MQYTLVPLVFRALGLARTIRAAEVADEEQAAASETAAAAAAAAVAAAATAKAEAEARAAADAAEGGANGGSGGGADDDGDAANGGENGKEGEGGGDETEAAAAPAEGDEDSGETVAAAAAAGESPATGAEGAGDDEGAFPPVPPAAAVARPRQFSSRKVYQFLHEIVTAMAPLHPWVSLSLFLQCAIGADRTGFKAIAYEFFSQVSGRWGLLRR